jgi:pyruvate kinase
MGPATASDERIEALIEAGMNVARLNFSHGSHADHRAMVERIRRISDKMRQPVAILQDLQGPKIRVGKFKDGHATLQQGARFRLCVSPLLGDERQASISYDGLANDVKPGDSILLDDGLLQLEVAEIGDGCVDTVVINGGVLKDRKGVNLPDTPVSIPSLTPKDREDLEFGIEAGVDYVALSFVRSGLDIHQLRCYLPRSESAPQIIAKIEKPQAVSNLREVISASDGIMIARGDLGVELPPEQVPIIQKRALRLANSLGRISITATQMLESMTSNPRPTRAEASDVANAIFDGTDAVMLSAETASGKYPVEAVTFMDRIVREAEASPFLRHGPDTQATDEIRPYSHAIAKAAAVAADELNVSALCCFSTSGRTPKLIKTFRPTRTIVAFTPSKHAYNRLALLWGTHPVLCPMRTETDALIEQVEQTLKAEGLAKGGDHVIIVLGMPVGRGMPTNMIKFHTIPSA